MTLGALRAAGFDVMTSNHAEAILGVDFAPQLAELTEACAAFRLTRAELIGSGGGEAAFTQRLRRTLSKAGWRKHNFQVETIIDGARRASVGHEVDHVRRTPRGTLALEIEWNNKDPFFDRDLESFQRLHALSAISVGAVVTRGASLQDALGEEVRAFIEARGIEGEASLIAFGMKDRTARQREAVARGVAAGRPFADAFARQFVADKFGPSTTHWSKLADRVARGVGNPCPMLLIGLPRAALLDEGPQGDRRAFEEGDLFGDL